jgi:hypothetical protein
MPGGQWVGKFGDGFGCLGASANAYRQSVFPSFGACAANIRIKREMRFDRRRRAGFACIFPALASFRTPVFERIVSPSHFLRQQAAETGRCRYLGVRRQV